MLMLPKLRDAIASSSSFLPNELVCEVLGIAGHETTEHRTFWRRLGRRARGEGRWQSVPDLSKFDEAHRFLLDEQTRVLHLQQPLKQYRDRLGEWTCTLARVGPEHTHSGQGRGISAGHALTAAWVDLQYNRSRK